MTDQSLSHYRMGRIESENQRLRAVLVELDPFLRHTLGELPPVGGWPYDVSSPSDVNPRLRKALYFDVP